jgi:hypothetical protein
MILVLMVVIGSKGESLDDASEGVPASLLRSLLAIVFLMRDRGGVLDAEAPRPGVDFGDRVALALALGLRLDCRA